MTPYWTVLSIDVTCTADGPHEICAGEPVRVGPGVIRRCATHAHVDVDWAEVDLARHRLEAAAAEDEARRARPVPTPTRVRLPRPVLSADFVQAGSLFDPKALAAGERSGK